MLFNAASGTILLGLVLGCGTSEPNDDQTPPETDADADTDTDADTDADTDVQWYRCDEAMDTTGCTQRINNDEVAI